MRFHARTLSPILLLAVAPALSAEPTCAPVAGQDAQDKRAAVSRELNANGCTAIDRLLKTSGGNPSIIDVLKAAFAPKKPRGDRLKPPNPAGMPSGAVVTIDGQLVFDAREAATEGLRSLDVTGGTLNVHVAPLPSTGVVTIPASRLVAGQTYQWVLRTDKWSYDATFKLPDADTANRVSARVAALSALQVSRATRLTLEAAIYDDEELYSSRDRVIEQLRAELQ